MEKEKREYARYLIKDNDLVQAIIDAGYFDKLEFKGMSKGDRDIPIFYFKKCHEVAAVIKQYQQETGKVDFVSYHHFPDQMDYLQFTGSQYAERMIREYGLLKEFVSAKEYIFLENDVRVKQMFYKFRQSNETRDAWIKVYNGDKEKDNEKELHN